MPAVYQNGAVAILNVPQRLDQLIFGDCSRVDFDVVQFEWQPLGFIII